jgi:branched-chain amino acid aminotransferase
MGLFEAYERGGETVVLTDGAGNVAEGPGFNVFAVFGNTVVTPAHGVLEGVTRRTMIELATREGCAMQVRDLSVDELRRADEIFLSSTGGGAVAVSFLDGLAISGREAGQLGPVTARLQAAYWALHEDARFVEAVRY